MMMMMREGARKPLRGVHCPGLALLIGTRIQKAAPLSIDETFTQA